ncbi:MAG: asparagine synthase (glutamine-hydrolyzing) [Patescibacteria group bacterium]|nr:asparagine synthase (glutamine-hydrolyzing) [Patescibacteria group bacterium]
MCGIAGFVGVGAKDELHRMTDAIARRGPDDEGFFVADGVGFGFRRLSIIDVAGGHQPLTNEDGSVWVMMNGEIYGYKSLMEELRSKGHRFKTQSDTEVIVHAYEEWGEACLEKLNGMFAIALWDSRSKRLLLARDRMGKKPLYWTIKKQTLWFASELKALLAAGVVDREMDPISLGLYFRTDMVPTPRSIFKNVQKLEPATAMIWKDGHVEKSWMFWEPALTPALSHRMGEGDANKLVSELGKMIDVSVAERLVSDVPLGLFLSGGLDSAVVAESAARQGGRMKAFTIGFDDPTHDESAAAKKVAQAFGLEHYVDVLKPEAAIAMIDEAAQLLDEPLADASILPQLLLSKFTRQQVTVALSGDGGDELLLGYAHIPAHQLINTLSFLRRRESRVRMDPWVSVGLRPRMTKEDGIVLKRLLNRVPASDGYFSLGFKTQRFARGLGAPSPWARDVRWRGAFDSSTLTSMLLPEVAHAADVDYAERQLAERANEIKNYELRIKNEEDAVRLGRATRDDVFWRQWSWAYLRTFLMDEVMVKVDRAGMWFALESRAPLLDTRVVEFLLNVPSQYKLGAWKKKRLFKELLKGKVPSDILNKPKHGFAVPVGAWLNGPLAERFTALTEPGRLHSQGLFDPVAVKRLADEHRAGRIDRRKEMWAMFMFQLWYDKWAK